MLTEPPSESFANSSSQCSRSVASMDIEKLLPITSGGPKLALSLPIKMLEPIGSAACMTRSFSASDTYMSDGPSANIRNNAKLPPKTDR